MPSPRSPRGRSDSGAMKLYKAAEVCELTDVQPYVLRSWEREFPGIGIQKSPDAPRLYRQSDIEQVRRIRQLVLGEGLTLAGARKRLGEEAPAPPEVREQEIAAVLDTLGADVKARVATVRNGLKTLLEMLSRAPGAEAVPELQLVPPVAGPARPARSRPATAKRAVATKRSSAARKPARKVRVARRSS